MGVRYDNRQVAVNNEEIYENLMEKRNVSHIIQYMTPEITTLTKQDMSDLSLIGHIWTQGDRFYKLAYKHYGNAEFWWIIAWFNKKPLEAHVSLGSNINIPTPLEEVLRLFKR